MEGQGLRRETNARQPGRRQRAEPCPSPGSARAAQGHLGLDPHPGKGLVQHRARRPVGSVRPQAGGCVTLAFLAHISSTNPQPSCPHASPQATSYTDGCWVSGCGSGESVQLWAARMEPQAGGEGAVRARLSSAEPLPSSTSSGYSLTPAEATGSETPSGPQTSRMQPKRCCYRSPGPAFFLSLYALSKHLTSLQGSEEKVLKTATDQAASPPAAEPNTLLTRSLQTSREDAGGLASGQRQSAP